MMLHNKFVNSPINYIIDITVSQCDVLMRFDDKMRTM